jgi:hypothetical protein
MHTPPRVGRAIALALALFAGTALAAPSPTCTLDDCQLSAELHRVAPSTVSVAQRWGWMAHDLAAIRLSSHQGHAGAALHGARALHVAMVQQMAWIDASGGRDWAESIQEGLQEVVAEHAGHALADLPPAAESAMPGV